MILELKRAVAYICPICSEVSVRDINIFDFSGSAQVKLPCIKDGCTDECVCIKPKKTKYKIDIECPLCDDVHTFQVNMNVFWKKDLFSLKCPASGIDIFFSGEEQKIIEAIEEQAEFFSECAEDFESNIGILYDIVGRLRDISADDQLYCTCGCHDITVSVEDDQLVLLCPVCGAKKRIDADEENLSRLLNASAVVLDLNS